LEFDYLNYLTPELNISMRLDKIRQQLLALEKPRGLYKSDVDTNVAGKWSSDTSTLFWPANVFYQYLVKSYAQLQDTQALDMYKKAIDAARNEKLFVKIENLTYAREYDFRAEDFDNKMNYEGCGLGGMLALGTHEMERALMHDYTMNVSIRSEELTRIQQHWKLAEEMAHTCQTIANRSRTGLPPQKFYFNEPGHYQQQFYYSAYLLT